MEDGRQKYLREKYIFLFENNFQKRHHLITSTMRSSGVFACTWFFFFLLFFVGLIREMKNDPGEESKGRGEIVHSSFKVKVARKFSSFCYLFLVKTPEDKNFKDKWQARLRSLITNEPCELKFFACSAIESQNRQTESSTFTPEDLLTWSTVLRRPYMCLFCSEKKCALHCIVRGGLWYCTDLHRSLVHKGSKFESCTACKTTNSFFFLRSMAMQLFAHTCTDVHQCTNVARKLIFLLHSTTLWRLLYLLHVQLSNITSKHTKRNKYWLTGEQKNLPQVSIHGGAQSPVHPWYTSEIFSVLKAVSLVGLILKSLSVIALVHIFRNCNHRIHDGLRHSARHGSAVTGRQSLCCNVAVSVPPLQCHEQSRW